MEQLIDRRAVLDRVVAALDAAGVDWAWQGPTGAPERWLGDSGPADLDIWWRPGSGEPPVDIAELVDRVRTEVPSAPVADARDPRRLRHTSLAVPTDTGLAVVDLTHGALMVGPLVLLPAGLVRTAGQRLVGAAAVADLLIRPVLRGRAPAAARLAEARAAWQQTPDDERRAAVAVWSAHLGERLTVRLRESLAGADVDAGLLAMARRRLIRATLAPRSLAASWRQRRTIVPAGRRATPLGLSGRGVVVALVGTDGSGKSTVAEQLAERLDRSGFATAPAYFGMARGNLPGVGLARRLLRVPVGAPSAAAAPSTAAPAADRPLLRRGAAWFYAAEYCWRYVRTVAPHRRRGRIVLVDRYVYDLRESPWPGSAASRVAEALVPRPDLLVLPDAPDALIHARKPERSPEEQAALQQRYRRLLAERPARVGEVVVDTSGATADPVAGLALAVIAAAHHTSIGEPVRAAGAAAH